MRRKAGREVDVLIAGDFNRHDHCDQIIDLMSDLSLESLLPRGTTTWSDGESETTIDLVLASDELVATTMVKCAIHGTEHGSDHRAINTAFDVAVPAPKQQERLLFKNAPWNGINERIARTLAMTPPEGTVQQRTDWLMSAVLEAVDALTPRAKPSPHVKR